MKRNTAFTVLLLAPLAMLHAADALKTPHQPPQVLQPVADKVAKAEPFSLSEVHLLEGPFKHAQELDRLYLLQLDPNLLLYPFRREAGLPSPVTGSDSGLYDFTGHYMGHYLSACALMIQNTGDAELKKRADSAVAALAECQAKNGDGFIMGFPKWVIPHMAGVDRKPGKVPFFGVPWYGLHKVYAGLLEMYVLTGNKQALEVVEKAAHWAGSILDQIDDNRMQEMLRVEHGGMNEILANLYAVTGNEEYLKWSLRFNHHEMMDPFAKGEDRLDFIHANTQIPKFTGAARQAALTGDQTLQTIALQFWNAVTRDRSYVTGGNSEFELFSPKAHLSEFLNGGGGAMETCNSYNMLKLTRTLFCQEPKPEYADYYERTLLNHILASQNPESGAMFYFEFLQSGQPKGGNWSKPNATFACCHGSGLESQAKYADSIYFHHGQEELFLNLFIASELNWKTKGLTLRQETNYPDEQGTRLRFTCEKPVPLTLKLRRPWWATSDFQIKINGKQQKVAADPGSYALLKRTWKSGDTLEVLMPMTFRMEGFKDNPRRAAVMYGPVVMAALTQRDNGFSSICADDDAFLKSLKPHADKPLEFEGAPSIFRTSPLSPGNEPVVFGPLFRLIEEPKVVYWDLHSKAELEGLAGEVKSEAQRQSSLKSSTVDMVLCGVNSGYILGGAKQSFQGLLAQVDAESYSLEWFKQVEEKAHAMEIGPLVGSPESRPRIFLPDGLFCPMQLIPKSWLTFRMKVLPDQEQRLQVRLWRPKYGSSRPNIGRVLEDAGKFEVLVDDQSIGTCDCTKLPTNRFSDQVFDIPSSLTKQKQEAKVSFPSAEEDKGVRAWIYECRIVKK